MDGVTAGRRIATLKEPWRGNHATYASIELDDIKVQQGEYSHCSFINVGFLGARLESCRFRQCIFVNCYFRKATLSSSAFVGCTFIDCNFNGTKVDGRCDFRYVRLRGCFLPYAEFELAMPSEPNLKEKLAQENSVAAAHLGNVAEARLYRLLALEARRQHLERAVKAESAYYATHFDTIGRIVSAFQLAWFYLNRILWKHGESAARLVWVSLIMVLAVSPMMLALFGGLPKTETSWSALIWLSVSAFLSIDRLSSTIPTTAPGRTIVAIDAALGVIFIGLYLSVLVKALLRR